MSNGTASAVCVIAVEEKPTKLTDFTLALEQFDGLKPAGQLEIRVTDIQPGDVVLDDENITYRLSWTTLSRKTCSPWSGAMITPPSTCPCVPPALQGRRFRHPVCDHRRDYPAA